jgi:hypothetical protein
LKGDEVDDGAEDVGQGDVGATPPGGESDAGQLLGLDAGGDRRVAEQGRGDAEARHGLAEALAEELAPEREDSQPREEKDDGAVTPLDRLGREQRAARAGEAGEREHEPEQEQPAVETAERAIEREQEQRKGRCRCPDQRGEGQPGPHRGDQGAEAGDAGGEEGGASEEGSGRRAGQALGVGGDAGGQVLELEAGQNDGDDEGGQAQAGGNSEQPAEEGIRADDDERDACDQQRQGGERGHRRILLSDQRTTGGQVGRQRGRDLSAPRFEQDTADGHRTASGVSCCRGVQRPAASPKPVPRTSPPPRPQTSRGGAALVQAICANRSLALTREPLRFREVLRRLR